MFSSASAELLESQGCREALRLLHTATIIYSPAAVTSRVALGASSGLTPGPSRGAPDWPWGGGERSWV